MLTGSDMDKRWLSIWSVVVGGVPVDESASWSVDGPMTFVEGSDTLVHGTHLAVVGNVLPVWRCRRRIVARRRDQIFFGKC